MKQLAQCITAYLSKVSGDEDAARIQWRAAQVRSMWAEVVEPIFLEHTNAVYIVKEDERKKLIVSVDESIFAAELNARREWIVFRFLKKFGEELDEVIIRISYGSFKKKTPYLIEIPARYQKNTVARELCEEELAHIEEVVAVIEDTKVRRQLKEAMIANVSRKSPQDNQREESPK